MFGEAIEDALSPHYLSSLQQLPHRRRHPATKPCTSSSSSTASMCFSMASLALPGMSGFVAELVVFFGLITSPKFLLMPKMLITFVMAIGMILTPIYLLINQKIQLN